MITKAALTVVSLGLIITTSAQVNGVNTDSGTTARKGNDTITMFDMNATGTTPQGVVAELSTLPASEATVSLGSHSSIGTFVGGPPGIGRGVYVLSALPDAGSRAPEANEATLEFYVTSKTPYVELSYVYLLGGTDIPLDYDFSDAFNVSIGERRCRRHGKPQRYGIYEANILDELTTYSSSKFVMTCVKPVDADEEMLISITARNTNLGSITVSAAVMMYAQSLEDAPAEDIPLAVSGHVAEEEYFRCEAVPGSTVGGSSCLKAEAVGECSVGPCTGVNYRADMGGMSCCVASSKAALSPCDYADFSSGVGCCQVTTIDSMSLVDSLSCL